MKNKPVLCSWKALIMSSLTKVSVVYILLALSKIWGNFWNA